MTHLSNDDLTHLSDDDLASTDDPVLLLPDECAGANVLDGAVEGGILPYLSLRGLELLLFVKDHLATVKQNDTALY